MKASETPPEGTQQRPCATTDPWHLGNAERGQNPPWTLILRGKKHSSRAVCENAGTSEEKQVGSASLGKGDHYIPQKSSKVFSPRCC